MHDVQAEALINEFGGTRAVSRICGVTSQAVSQWKRNGIPRPWMQYLLLRRDLPAKQDGANAKVAA